MEGFRIGSVGLIQRVGDDGKDRKPGSITSGLPPGDSAFEVID